jgi:hypothetical protein
VDPIRLTPPTVETLLPAEERIRRLEHRLELERARREAIEQGLDRLSDRCGRLARENAALRELVPNGTPLPEPV